MILRHKILLSAFLASIVLVGLGGIFFGKDMLRIVQTDTVNESAGIPQTTASSTALNDFIATVPRQFVTTGCDESLWQHNAEDEKVSARCIYVTGVVERVRPEDDGDMNIQLKPDPQYSVLLNSYNIKDGEGNIDLEPICVVSPSSKAFIKSCKGYSNHVFIPAAGMHIGAIGSYGQDKHLWMEIHPVTSINVL